MRRRRNPSRAEKQERTRGALLRAASRLFCRRGLEGTSIDEMYEAARHAGAIGGKLLGAGGGGYVAFYCPTNKQHEVRGVLEGMGGSFSDFAFDGQGMQVWRSASR